MKHGTLPLLIFFIITLPSVLNAQEMNDELKKRMRESLLAPDMPSLKDQQQHNPLQLDLERNPNEVLKVSPFTRLPTKYDRIRISPKTEELKVQMHIIPSNAPPINTRPTGSTEYVHEFGKMSVRSNAGELVVPSGNDFDLIRARKARKTEKHRKKLKRILDAY